MRCPCGTPGVYMGAKFMSSTMPRVMTSGVWLCVFTSPGMTMRRRASTRSRGMPGLVNTHNHTPLVITRGMVEDMNFAPMYTPGVPQGHRIGAEEAYLLARLGAWDL